MIDIPGQRHEPGEGTRLYTQDHRIGDGSSCALLAVQEAQAWLICDAMDPDVGVRVSKDRMILLARAILRCEAEREIASQPTTDQGAGHGR